MRAQSRAHHAIIPHAQRLPPFRFERRAFLRTTIALVAHSAYNRRVDRRLIGLDVRHFFNSTVLHIGLRRNVYLTRHLIAFIELFAPHLKLDEIRKAITS